MSKYTELMDSIVGRCNNDGEVEKRCKKLENEIQDIVVNHISNNETFIAMYCAGFDNNINIYLNLDEISKEIIKQYKILVYGDTLRNLVIDVINGFDEIDYINTNTMTAASKLTNELFSGILDDNRICIKLDLKKILGGE